jgi:hypothetical protein
LSWVVDRRVRSRSRLHLGSAHDAQAAEALKAVARQRLAGGQGELELGMDTAAVAVGASAAPLQIVSSQMVPLWEALCAGNDQLGLDEATGGDEVFRQLVLARTIETTSKVDSLRRACQARAGVVAALRGVHVVLRDRRRRRVPRAGFSKERRLEPQITIGLLTDASGFPLMVEAFDGSRI